MDNRPTPGATRREGVRTIPIVLADGQAWGLAAPSPRLRPEIVPGVDALGRPTERIRVVAEVGYPLEIRRLVADLRVACGAGPAARPYDAWFGLAIALLRRAHDLDLAEAAELLDPSPADLPSLVDAVLAIVTGGPSEDRDLPTTEKADA